MTVVGEGLSVFLCIAGTLFFVAGALGLLRFPDVYTRLHAVTKADNLGLGLIAAGITLRTSSWLVAWKVILIWLLAMLASTTACNLIANAAVRGKIRPWQAEERASEP
jgi:multicomponent Na+:H+ antiporter subunit G